MKEKLRTWCLLIGVGMAGPVLLGLAITCLFVGEIPGRRDRALIRAVDNPAVFYVAAIAFVFIAAKFTQFTWRATRSYYRGAKQRGSL